MIVERAETDVFRLAPIVDYMLNPVNTIGVMGAGLAAEFKRRHPEMFLEYEKECKDGKLKIGRILTYNDPKVSYRIINIPTKRHWADPSLIEDIKKSVQVLREFLLRPENKMMSVAMPMLGCGLGKLEYEPVLPLFYEYLDDLDNIIHVCMMPNRMPHIPQYLGVIGPRAYADYQAVDAGIKTALARWNLDYGHFDRWVSGGAPGVDTIGCGHRRDDISYQESLSKKYCPNLPIICLADWDRYNTAAGFVRNRTIADIATHVVAFRPEGVSNKGTTNTIRRILKTNKEVGPQSRQFTRIHIIGCHDLNETFSTKR